MKEPFDVKDTLDVLDHTIKETQVKARELIKTAMLYHYFIGFAVRLLIFLGIFLTYLLDKDFLVRFMTRRFAFGEYGFNILHVLWAFFMVIMISHLLPLEKKSMALLKSRESKYEEIPGYSRLELLEQVQKINQKAWIVMLLWLSFNAVFGILFLAGILDRADLLMLTVFFFLSDYICILFFCPFQTKIMKNKCCISCRIYDWGHFMMFTPMLFIKSFFSWSLFFTSIVVLIHWELVYAKYPERFSEISNKKLQCANCNDKTCQVKRRLEQRRK